MSPRSLLKDVHDGSDRWSIVVRVLRKWNVYQKSYPNDLFCITMVLLDQEGNKIQATAIPKNLHAKYRDTLVEGKTYFIVNFVVSPNTNQYKATQHQFKISFTQQTFVKEEPADIPTMAFTFKPLCDILKTDEKDFTDSLIDVIAFVKTISPLEEYHRDNETKQKLKMLLTDINDNEVECILFDECSSNAYMAQLENMETPVVVLINLARIGWSEDGIPQVCSSFNATRVSFNPPIPEVKALIDSAKERESPITTTLSQVMPTQSTQTSSSSILSNNYRISLSDIPQQKLGESFVVNCMIQKLETRHGWTYDGCSKCSCKPGDEGSKLMCPNCKKQPDSIEPKLKIHYTVVDETGSASVIFWDKLASQLLDKSAPELKLLLKSEDREYDFPDQCDSIVGKRILLKLKRNAFNAKHLAAGISVQQYTLCQDLTEHFDQASTEPPQDATPYIKSPEATPYSESPVNTLCQDLPEKPTEATPDSESPPQTESSVQVTQSNKSSSEPEDLTLLQLSQNAHLPAGKGKRKALSKRTVVESASSSATQTSSASIPNSTMLKVVKQEK